MSRLLALALVLGCARVATAQGRLDHIVENDTAGRPLEFRGFTSHQLGEFSRAAHVPIGIELLPARKALACDQPPILSGRTALEAAQVMVACDPRYTFSDDNGVIVFGPVDPPASDPLSAAAPAIHLEHTNGKYALNLAATLLGAPRATDIQLSETKVFALDHEEGTIRSLLNAIVRSHGELVWTFERVKNAENFPYMIGFMSGPFGSGYGVSGVGSALPLDPSQFGLSNRLPLDALDTIVGARRDGRPVEVTGIQPWTIEALAQATRTSFGLQIAAAAPALALEAQTLTATGRTLRDVLDLLVARDPRYYWRVIDGTVVIRPVNAWSDSGDPLFALVRDVELQDVTMSEAVEKVLDALGGGKTAGYNFPDSRKVSFASLHGSALDLLTALAKAHGWLTWTLDKAEPKEIAQTGLTHRITIGVGGQGGIGSLVRMARPQ